MNSIGLENPGVESFLADELQQMSNIDTVKIANLGGSTLETYIEGARLIEEHNKKVKTNEKLPMAAFVIALIALALFVYAIPFAKLFNS